MRRTTAAARLALCVLVAVGAPRAAPAVAPAAADHADRRARMVEVIRQHARDAGRALGGRGLDPAVLGAMAAVPRHEFVPENVREHAYEDRPLPIGAGQTISQPFMVALMTDLLDVDSDDVVLEVGTGSGYQAAVLAPLAAEVYSIEIVPQLGESAAERLERLGYDNVHVRVGDGYYGWPEAGPFDGIVVTAAASHIPPPLIQQLSPGGRMVIPVGGAFARQQLMLVEKGEDGAIRTRQILPVRFVPLTGTRT
jgi:protein-L-isoaspartate(D-aspartate) O-methyltransferase